MFDDDRTKEWIYKEILGFGVRRSVTLFEEGAPGFVKIIYSIPSGTENLAERDDFGRVKRAYTFAASERIGYKSKKHAALYVKDHLGSTRMTLALFRGSIGESILTQASDTDPYGFIWRDIPATGPESGPHGYTGQEREDDLGLMVYGARFYMPEIERFLQVDPARVYVNGDSYIGNSPQSGNDPIGEIPWIVSLYNTVQNWDSLASSQEGRWYFMKADLSVTSYLAEIEEEFVARPFSAADNRLFQ